MFSGIRDSQQLKECISFHEMLSQIQTKYSQTKQIQEKKKPKNNNIYKRRYTLHENEQYNQLTSELNYIIQRSKISFREHKYTLQEQIYLLNNFFENRSYFQQQRFMQFLVRILIKTDKLLQNWMQEEVSSMYQQIQNLFGKNIYLQQQLNIFSYQYQLVKQNLQQQRSYRIQIQNTLLESQKQLNASMKCIKQLQRQKNDLLSSKNQLQQQIQSKQVYELNLSKVVSSKDDILRQINSKVSRLLQQNQQFKKHNHSLLSEVQMLKNQMNSFTDEIKHLEEVIDNQTYQLDFYKNRQNTSMMNQSYQKLNVIEGFDKLNGSKISLSEFHISHQKSLEKVYMLSRRHSFLQREKQHERSEKSLNQFDYVVQNQQNINLNLNTNNQNMSNFNQITFRPELQADGKYKTQKQDNLMINISQQKQNNHLSQQNSLLYQIQPLNFTENKLKSNANSDKYDDYTVSDKKYEINKRLRYQYNSKEIIQLDGHESNDETSHHKSQQKSNNSKLSKVKSSNHLLGTKNNAYTNTKLLNGNPLKLLNTNKSQFTLQTHFKQQSTLDNRSQYQTNSVNKLLIKRNIQKRKQVNQLQQQLLISQKKIRQYQQLISQLQDQIYSYKQQFNKINDERIRYKSQIYSMNQVVQIMENEKNKIEEINQEMKEQIDKMNQYIHKVNQQLQMQKFNYQDRIKKVKQFCKTYLEDKHKKQIKQITQLYERQINQLKIKLENQIQNNQVNLINQTVVLQIYSNLLQQQIITSKQKQNIHVHVQTEYIQEIQNKEQININNDSKQNNLKIISLPCIYIQNTSRPYNSPHLDKKQLSSPLNIHNLQTKNTLSSLNSQFTSQSSQNVNNNQIRQYLQIQRYNEQNQLFQQDKHQHQHQQLKIQRQGQVSIEQQKQYQQQQQKQQYQQQVQVQKQHDNDIKILLNNNNNNNRQYQQHQQNNQTIYNNDNFVTCIQLDQTYNYHNYQQNILQQQQQQNIFEVENNINILQSLQLNQNIQQNLNSKININRTQYQSFDSTVIINDENSMKIGKQLIKKQNQTNILYLNLLQSSYQQKSSYQEDKLFQEEKSCYYQDEKNSLIKISEQIQQEKQVQVKYNQLQIKYPQKQIIIDQRCYKLQLIVDENNNFSQKKLYQLQRILSNYLIPQFSYSPLNSIKLSRFISPSQLHFNIQTSYILHLSSQSYQQQQSNKNKQIQCNQNRQIQCNQNNKIFILSKNIIYDLCNKKKLQLINKSYFNCCYESNMICLGNNQVRINNYMIQIDRQNKKSFYKGNLKDSKHKINYWQEISILYTQNHNINNININ